MAQIFCGDPCIPHQGFTIVQDGRNWYHLNVDGKPAYKERYSLVEHFQGGVAWARDRSGAWIRIDRQGHKVKTNTTNVVLDD